MNYTASSIAKDFHTVQDVLDAAHDQAASVRGKNTPFRVEFRFGGGSARYQYYENLAAAEAGTCQTAGYGPTGRAYVRNPRSKQVQARGPRGGWRKYVAAGN